MDSPLTPPQAATVGRIVHYRLTNAEAEEINSRRQDARVNGRTHRDTSGAQIHMGNTVAPGETVPMIVVVAWSDTLVNGQAFLDGTDSLWITSAHMGEGEGQWMWPPRV